MKVSVIIVHWNTPDILKRQLLNLRPSSQIEVIVVDNNSDRLPTVKSPYRLVRCSENNGFASGCNRGAAIAKGEWVLFLNPDTHLTSAAVLSFVQSAKAHNLDAASPLQRTEDYYKPLPTPLSLMLEFTPLHRFIRLPKSGKHTLFGGCLLIKREVLEALDGWDERFFIWFEDSDLTRRLLDNGYKIGWIEVSHNHAGGSSFKQLTEDKRKKIFFTSMNHYASKHFGFLGKLVVKFLTFLNK